MPKTPNFTWITVINTPNKSQKLNFKSTEFLQSASALSNAPADFGCEVAFAGRSNALISDIIKYQTLDAPCHLVYAYFAPNIPSHGRGVMAKKQIFQQHRSIFYLFLKQAKRQESCVDGQYHYTAHPSYTERCQLIRTESEKREYTSSCIHNPKSCRMLSFSPSNTTGENGVT